MSPSPVVAVLIPVLGRPDRVEPLLASLTSSQGVVRAEPLFLVSPGDYGELRAVDGHDVAYEVVPWRSGPGDYARKINWGFRLTDTPWVFCAADDLRFHPGWADEALEAAARTGAQVVGTDDLGNDRVTSGRHATHSLVARRYVDATGATGDATPGVVLHEGYDHNWVDDELVGVARHRGVFAFAARSKVEHLHPHWRKSRMDATYRKGLRRFDADRKLNQERAHLWGVTPVRPGPRLFAPIPRRPRG